MSDKYESLRSLPFPALASALGLDLSRFKTRKSGQEYYGACPIHNPKNNSTSFSYLTDGRFNCFSCGAKGKGTIDLIKQVKDIGFQAAVELLQALPTVEPSKEKSPVTEASSVLQPLAKDSWRKFAVPCPWLEARCQDPAIRERYGIFCYKNPSRKSAYSGRVMIPIKDVEGILYGYLGRAIDDNKDTNPKYLFPRDFPKSRFLFGSDVLKAGMFGPAPLRVCYLVESPFAVLKFASLGFPAVSPFGWSVSEEQIQSLQYLAKGVIYIPDRNKSQSVAEVVQLLAQRVWTRFPPLPDGIDDPEYLSPEQIQALTH